MYDDGRYPPDVLAQLSAVRRAIDGVALIILEDHIESCVHKAVAGRGNQPTAQLMQGIRRYLKTR
jgi:DNA-binding FrmR family transcriptional regulator